MNLIDGVTATGLWSSVSCYRAIALGRALIASHGVTDTHYLLPLGQTVHCSSTRDVNIAKIYRRKNMDHEVCQELWHES